jgi:small subunit ribosomal protein S4
MARYIGPKVKIARKFGTPIYGSNKAYARAFENKNYPPGQHGLAKKRKKVSEYGIQLNEKQKLKYTYGLLERQFRNVFEKASRLKGRKGDNLLQLLESRLDNVVYRLGIAPTRAAARQLVGHRHIVLNGEICNIPSAFVTPGDIVGVREKSKSLEVIQEHCKTTRASRYSWMEWDSNTFSGKFLSRPERVDIPETVNEQLIVELYSK